MSIDYWFDNPNKPYNKYVVVRIERSDGLEMEFGSGTDWHIPNDGLRNIANNPYTVNTTPNVLTDGSTVVSTRTEEGDRTLVADYLGEDEDFARQSAINFFNPKFKFIMNVTYRGRTLRCEGRQIGFMASEGNVYQPVSITWTILTPNPYWADSEITDNTLDYANARFGFPYVSHVKEVLPNGERHPIGLVVSQLVYNGEGIIYNDGDLPTMYTVQIKANSELQNPAIVKDGRFVRYFGRMIGGDILEIDFEASPPTVTLNGDDVIPLCDRESSFTNMQMQVGKNIFELVCDNPEQIFNAEVKVIFRKKWLGV